MGKHGNLRACCSSAPQGERAIHRRVQFALWLCENFETTLGASTAPVTSRRCRVASKATS